MARINIDTRQVMAGFARLTAVVENGAKEGRRVVGDELLRLSQIEVPHDEGTLANSGISEEIGNEQVVGYHTPYAARLHEHPEYEFQKGRKGKYLEEPIKQNINEFGKIFAETVEGKM